jgi:hypothetical protein
MAAAHMLVAPPGAAAIPNPFFLIMGVQGTCPRGVQGQSPWPYFTVRTKKSPKHSPPSRPAA